MSERLEKNIAILRYLEDFMRDHPYMRFNQVLVAFGVDPLKYEYQESEDTLNDIINAELDNVD